MKIKTVGDLRKWLDLEEKKHESVKDRFGEFELQEVWFPVFTNKGKFKGYGTGKGCKTPCGVYMVLEQSEEVYDE